jgi:hypothetical protein
MAQQAIDNAFSFEVLKDGLQQRQNGDWVLRFTAQNIDLNKILINARMGTRFHCTLVELGDDETPVDHKAMDRDKWRALGSVKQAGIRCKDPIFWAFLRENYEETIVDETAAAEAVRYICNVLTRSDLGKPGFSDQRILWFDLDNKFQAWKAKEHAGA